MTAIWLILKNSRLAQIGLGAVVLLIAAALWLHFHDKGVIENHEAGISEQVTTATTSANDTANANDAKRQADNARTDEQLRGAIADETAKHPEEVRRDAGPATQKTLEVLRRRHQSGGVGR